MVNRTKFKEAVDRFEETVLLAAMEGVRQAERGVGFKGLSQVERFGPDYLAAKKSLYDAAGVVAPSRKGRRSKLANG